MHPHRFNFRAQNRVEIRFSDNPRQKETMTSFGSGEKMCNLQIRYHFQYNSCVEYQLALSEGYTQISVEGYRKKDTKLHTMSETWEWEWEWEYQKWEWLVVSMGHLVDISEEIAVYAYGNA